MTRDEFNTVGKNTDEELALLSFVETDALEKMIAQHNEVAELQTQLDAANAQLLKYDPQVQADVAAAKKQAAIDQLKAMLAPAEQLLKDAGHPDAVGTLESLAKTLGN